MINSLLSQSERAADTAGRVIEARLTDGRSAVESLAADPPTVDIRMRRDIQRLTARLREAHDLQSEITFWGMYDSEGFLRVGYPQPDTHVSGSFASSDWFTGATRTRPEHVSAGSPAVRTCTGLSLLLWPRH